MPSEILSSSASPFSLFLFPFPPRAQPNILKYIDARPGASRLSFQDVARLGDIWYSHGSARLSFPRSDLDDIDIFSVFGALRFAGEIRDARLPFINRPSVISPPGGANFSREKGEARAEDRRSATGARLPSIVISKSRAKFMPHRDPREEANFMERYEGKFMYRRRHRAPLGMNVTERYRR